MMWLNILRLVVTHVGCCFASSVANTHWKQIDWIAASTAD
jgi:hypothetical protein